MMANRSKRNIISLIKILKRPSKSTKNPKPRNSLKFRQNNSPKVRKKMKAKVSLRNKQKNESECFKQ